MISTLLLGKVGSSRFQGQDSAGAIWVGARNTEKWMEE